jgi:hypothetical protein
VDGLLLGKLAVHPEYYDAWIAVGVENYMLSVKPAPLRWLLMCPGPIAGLPKLKLPMSRAFPNGPKSGGERAMPQGFKSVPPVANRSTKIPSVVKTLTMPDGPE